MRSLIIAGRALGLTGFALLASACSASPSESTGAAESAVTGVLRPMTATNALLTRSSYAGQITNGNGGCLDLPNGDTTNGNLLHIWACDASGWNQTWFVDARGSIHYAANPTKCVDFPAQSLVNGVPTNQTQLQLWDCNGASGPDQVWQISLTGNVEFAADTAKCVELRNGSSANNTPVQVFDCNGTSGQTWKLVQGGGVQGFQLQDANGACLQPASAASGAALLLEPCNGNVALQQWGMDGRGGLFDYATGQYVTFPAQNMTATTFVAPTPLGMANEDFAQGQTIALSASNHTMLIGGLACVEAHNGSSAPNTVVQGYTCNGTSGQTWFPMPMGGTCPGTVASNGTCIACGAAGEAPCTGNVCSAGAWLFGTTCTSTVHPAPPYSEIQSSISVFMGTKNTYDFESSNPTIGTPGQMLYGAENPERDLLDGDEGQVWHDANTMTMLADYQMAGDLLGVSTDSGSQSVVEAYVNKGYNVLVPFANYSCSLGSSECGLPNQYNDDDLWWALAYLRGYDLEVVTGDLQTVTNGTTGALASEFMTGAETVFTRVCAQWNASSVCGGGVPQTAPYGVNPAGEGVITNALMFETAMQLALENPNATNVCAGQVPWTTAASAPTMAGGPSGLTHAYPNTYLGWALAEYEFFKKNWWSKGSIPMADGLDASCNPTGTLYTYNQGPILGALLDLSKMGGYVSGGLSGQGESDSPATVLGYGFQIASAAMNDVSFGGLSRGGVLTELPASSAAAQATNDQACINVNSGKGDCPEFKGVFMRYLARFASQAAAPAGPYADFTARATDFINFNATTVYGTRSSTGYFGEDWSNGAFSNLGLWNLQTIETSGMDALVASLELHEYGPPPPPPAR